MGRRTTQKKRAAFAALLGCLRFPFRWTSTLSLGKHVRLKSHEFEPLLDQVAVVLDIAVPDRRVDHRRREAVDLHEPSLQTAPLALERAWRHALDAEFFDELVDFLKRLHLRSFALARCYSQVVHGMSMRQATQKRGRLLRMHTVGQLDCGPRPNDPSSLGAADR